MTSLGLLGGLFLAALAAGSILPLQILAFAAPFRFFSAGLTIAAVETSHVRERVAWQFGIGIAAVGLTLALLPRFGLPGAASAMVIAEVALACAYWRLALKNRPGEAPTPLPQV